MRSPRLLQIGLGVPRLAVGEQSDVAVGEIVAVILVKLIAARALHKNEVVALGRLEGCAVNAVGEKGELGARARRHG